MGWLTDHLLLWWLAVLLLIQKAPLHQLPFHLVLWRPEKDTHSMTGGVDTWPFLLR